MAGGAISLFKQRMHGALFARFGHVRVAFQALGADLLKPVYEELGGSLDYDQLKLIRLHFLSSQGKL